MDRIRYPNHPQNCTGKPNGPSQMPRPKQRWQIENPQTTRKQHDGSNRLNRKLRVRSDRINIVIDAKQENYGPGHKNRQEHLQKRTRNKSGEMPTAQQRNPKTDQKREKYGHAAEAR